MNDVDVFRVVEASTTPDCELTSHWSWSFKLAKGAGISGFFEVVQHSERNVGRAHPAEKAVEFLGRRVTKASMRSV